MTGAGRPAPTEPLIRMIDALPGAALLTDADQRIVALNARFEALTGYGIDDLAGRNCRVLQTPDTDPATVAAIRAALGAETGFSGEVLNRRRDGRLFWNALQIDPVLDGAGAVTGYIGMQADVTASVAERAALADRLRTAEMLLDALPRFTSDDVAEVAQALCDATAHAGAPAALLLQEHDGEYRVLASAGPLVVPAADEVARALLETADWPDADGALLAAHHRRAPESSLRARDVEHAVVVPIVPRRGVRAALVALWSTGSGVDSGVGAGDRPTVAARMERLAELGRLALDNQEFIERVRAAAQRDDLTGLFARSVIQATLERALTDGSGPVAVLYLDVDRFKRMNDSLGHAGGDELLTQIAERIRAAVGARGTAGRLGGDEFVVVVPDADEGAAHDLQRRIADHLREPFLVAGRTVFARASCGAAVGALLPGEAVGAGAARIMQEADTAMYAVKRHDRPSAEIDSDFDLVALEVDLRRAVAAQEVHAWFQPQYDGRTGAIRGFEALARWRHPTLGWIEPDVFIPLAEDALLIGAIGRSVLAEAARFADDRAAELGPIAMCVNVSRAELLSEPGYVARIEAVLAARRRSDWFLTLEIKEGDFEHDAGGLEETLVELRRLGVAVAIDDFGSGSSSLRLLQDLPVTALKVDKSFLRRTGALREGLITAIVNLGLGLGLDVMAEGVENRMQLETLRRLRCSSVQGYLLGAPSPASSAAHAPATVEEALVRSPEPVPPSR